MKYFIDSEFMEDGYTIDLLSFAVVCEDGREFYWVNSNADRTKANPWVAANVIPQLDLDLQGGLAWRAPRSEIADAVRLIVGDDKPEFWGYYSAYDWVAFCQMFGAMIDLPKGWPMFCRDIIQECKRLGNPELPKQGNGEHHALADARWNKVAFEFLNKF